MQQLENYEDIASSEASSLFTRNFSESPSAVQQATLAKLI